MKMLVIIMVVFSLFACRHTELTIEKTIVTPAGPGKTIEVTLSNQITLMRNGELGLSYFPDEAVILVRRKPTFRMLVTSAISSYLLEGRDLHNITSAKEVLTPGGKGSFDNGYAGISGCHRYSDGKLYAFYHGEDQEDMGSLIGGIPGYYGSVDAAVSEDDGMTWKKSGQVITSFKPKQWNAYAGQQDKGAGEPGVVMEKSSIYIAFSDNGINWSAPENLIKDFAIPLLGKSFSWMANIIWDDNSSTEGWLIYGHSPSWGHEYNDSGIPHYMAGRRIRFTVELLAKITFLQEAPKMEIAKLLWYKE